MLATRFTQGYYSVNGEIFSNKMFAVKRALETNQQMRWHYFDEVFDQVSTTNLGQVRLDELYRQRAQQLRDSYDYLVIYYSGGSDSWNMLNTFLKNNIKVDCVYVWRASKATDKDIYTPNKLNLSDSNLVSEWDFVIKGDLEWLAAHHPQIHIEIGDWTDVLINTADTPFERILETASTQNTVCTLFKNICPCKYEHRMLDQGKTVAKVLGIEKPKIEEHLGKYYFYFVDVCCISLPDAENPSGLEYFYISPDFPSLTVEQAYAVLSYYKNLPEKLPLIASAHTRPPGWSYQQVYQVSYQQESEERIVLYPDWDMSKFQASKSTPDGSLPPGFRSNDKFLLSLPEFREASDKWGHHWREVFSPADRKNRQYFVVESQLKPTYSKRHFLADVG